MTNIAIEAMAHRNRWFTELKNGGSVHGYVSHNQRVAPQNMMIQHSNWSEIQGFPSCFFAAKSWFHGHLVDHIDRLIMLFTGYRWNIPMDHFFLDIEIIYATTEPLHISVD